MAFRKNLVQRSHKSGGVFTGEAERGTQLEDVVMGAVGASEDALFAEAVDDVRGLAGGWSAGFAIGDQINPKKKSGAAHIADERVLCLE